MFVAVVLRRYFRIKTKFTRKTAINARVIVQSSTTSTAVKTIRATKLPNMNKWARARFEYYFSQKLKLKGQWNFQFRFHWKNNGWWMNGDARTICPAIAAYQAIWSFLTGRCWFLCRIRWHRSIFLSHSWCIHNIIDQTRTMCARWIVIVVQLLHKRNIRTNKWMDCVWWLIPACHRPPLPGEWDVRRGVRM